MCFNKINEISIDYTRCYMKQYKMNFETLLYADKFTLVIMVNHHIMEALSEYEWDLVVN